MNGGDGHRLVAADHFRWGDVPFAEECLSRRAAHGTHDHIAGEAAARGSIHMDVGD